MDSRPIPLLPDDSQAAPHDPGSVAADDFLSLPVSPRYCPTALLAGFALLMAGHGRCVNTDMMLGDSEYAIWQLSCAKAMDDAELAAVTMRLYGYFDDPRHAGTPILGTA